MTTRVSDAQWKLLLRLVHVADFGGDAFVPLEGAARRVADSLQPEGLVFIGSGYLAKITDKGRWAIGAHRWAACPTCTQHVPVGEDGRLHYHKSESASHLADGNCAGSGKYP